MINFIRQFSYRSPKSYIIILGLLIASVWGAAVLMGKHSTTIPTHASTPSQMTWRTVYTFSGNTDQVTNLFMMQGHWRIVWSCDAVTMMGFNSNTFKLVVSSPEEAGVTVANVVCADRGVSDMYMTDDAYLQITSRGNWKVQIQKQ